MKKLFLLLSAGFIVTAVNAQDNQSVVLTHGTNTPSSLPFVKHAPMAKYAGSAQAKQTSTQSAWFSFADAAATLSVSAGLFPIYNDSTLYVPNGNPTGFNWYIAGLGTSFDPTSARFTPAAFQNSNSTYPQPSFGISKTNAYSVDSVTVVGYYFRKPYNNYVDTLNIYVAYVPNTNATTLQAKDVYYLNNLNIPDSTLRFATAKYDSATNSISSSVGGLIKITKILNAAAFADSLGANTHQFTFPITMSVPQGGKVMSYQQFISGHKYRTNIDIDSANTWDVLTYERNGASTFPDQLQGDLNAGLIVTNESRYQLNNQGVVVSGVQYTGSTYQYGATAGFDDPFYAFHVICTGCFNAGVANVNNTISSANAYPNPATSEVFIPFTLSRSASVNVSVVNTLGQIINAQNFTNVTSGKATVNTSTLASGIYFYTVEANGERTTGRFVVAH